MDLSVAIPSYLEEENLRLILPRLNKVLQSSGLKYEVLVIDTQTPMDATPTLCRELNCRYLMREGGNSYGDAVRTAIKNAQGAFLLFMDADGSHPPEFINNMLEKSRDYDVVIASRYTSGGHTENHWSLVFMSQIVNLGFRIALNLPYRDISNSFKLYRTEQLRALSLRSQNFEIIEELLYKLRKSNPKLAVCEVPFTFKKRLFGKTKRNLFRFFFSYLYILIYLRFMA